MKFEARKIDMNLEVCSGEETQVFVPHQKPSAAFSDRVREESKAYLSAQKSLPEAEQDTITTGYLKSLAFIYKDFDKEWVKNNFTPEEIKAIHTWAFEQLHGVKKD